MADIKLKPGESLPETVKIKYTDQGDGTHALVIYVEVG